MQRELQIQFAKHVKLQAPLPRKPSLSIKHPLVVVKCANGGMKQKGGPLTREAATARAMRLFAP